MFGVINLSVTWFRHLETDEAFDMMLGGNVVEASTSGLEDEFSGSDKWRRLGFQARTH
jgi:hypothetical protein